jgi:hypothetical protein
VHRTDLGSGRFLISRDTAERRATLPVNADDEDDGSDDRPEEQPAQGSRLARTALVLTALNQGAQLLEAVHNLFR